EHDDGDGAPRDPQDREGGAQSLRRDVVQELPDQLEGAHGPDRSADGPGRLLEDPLPFGEPGDDLDVDRVAEPRLDRPLLRGAVVAQHGDPGAAVLEGDDALGDGEDVLAPLDDDVGVGAVTRAESGAAGVGQADLDGERGRVLLLLRLERDLLDDAMDLRVRERADADDDGHPFGQAPDVDLVDGAAEDEVVHVGHGHEDRALLVAAERHHGVADLDHLLEDEAVDGGLDDGLDPGVGDGDPPLLEEREALARDLELDLRLGESAVRGVELLLGDEASLLQFALARELAAQVVELDLPELELAACFDELEGRRVGADLEERVAGADEVADVRILVPDHARDLGLHANLDFRLDGADREGAIDELHA